MATKFNKIILQVIIPKTSKRKIDKLIQHTRTSSLKNEMLVLSDNSQQNSIIYSWNLPSKMQVDKLSSLIKDIFAKEYYEDYFMLERSVE